MIPGTNPKKDIAQQFDENAKKYDSQRRKLIPCFNDFYSVPLSMIHAATSNPTVLDVGAGTGLFSSLILDKYPEANITLIDLSEKMMEEAKKRFVHSPNIKYVVSDYTNYEFEHKFDFVISSLSIHHLTDAEKRNMYKRINNLLKDGGVFLNADQVLGETEFLEKLYRSDWESKVDNSGLTKEEIDAAYERTKLDKMSTLNDQLIWLKESGFRDVDCLYKYFNFVVLFGQK